MNIDKYYLKVTSTFSVILAWNTFCFCHLYMVMLQGRQILMFYTTIVHLANDCGYKILHIGANPQKYQTLVPAKTSHLKQYACTDTTTKQHAIK